MCQKLSQYEYEIILVNDCSPNGTTYQKICEIATGNTHVKGINLARNFGQPSAVMAALNHAKGDYVVCGDDDGQTPFSELPRLFEKLMKDMMRSKQGLLNMKSVLGSENLERS